MLPRLDELKSHLDNSSLGMMKDSLDADEKASQDVLRTMIKQHFVWGERYKSDFSQEFYQAQGAVTPLVTGSGDREDLSLKQQMIIINTKDMINIFKSRMKALQDSLVQL